MIILGSCARIWILNEQWLVNTKKLPAAPIQPTVAKKLVAKKRKITGILFAFFLFFSFVSFQPFDKFEQTEVNSIPKTYKSGRNKNQVDSVFPGLLL